MQLPVFRIEYDYYKNTLVRVSRVEGMDCAEVVIIS